MTYKELPSWAKDLYRTALKNAATRGIEFAISQQDFAELVARSGERCMLTGIPFEHGAFRLADRGKGRRRPFAPSLDRVDSGCGYRPGNIRLINVAANLALNEWGESVFRRVAAGLLGIGDPAEALWRGRGANKYLPGVKRRISKANGRVTWVAKIVANGQEKYLGVFGSEGEAALAAQRAREQLRNADVPGMFPSDSVQPTESIT